MNYVPLTLGPDMVKLYRKVNSNQSYNYAGFTTGIDTYGDDVLFFCWNTPYLMRPVLVSQPMAVQNIVGRPKTFGSSILGSVNVSGNRPERLDWDPQSDWARYGSMLLLNSQLTEERPGEHIREHGVNHPSYVGDLTDTANWDYLYHEHVTVNWDWFGASFHPWELVAGLPAPLYMALQLGYSASGYPTYYEWFDLYDPADLPFTCDGYTLAKDILSKPDGSHHTSFGDTTYIEYSDFDGDCFKDGNHFEFDISYTLRKVDPRTSPETFSSFRVRVRFLLEFREVFGNVDDAGIWTYIHPDVVSFSDFSSVTAIGSGGPSGPFPQSIGDGLSFTASGKTQFLTQPYRGSVTDEPNFYSFRRYGHPNDINWMHDFVNQNVQSMMWQLRPSSFLSAADALDKQMVAFKGNLLQNLQHVKDIMELIPDPAGFERLIAKAIKGDPSAIKEAIDLLTEYILKYRFQIAPLLRDLEKLGKVELAQVAAVAKPQRMVAYGQYRYTFLDSENFMGDGTLKLVTRSKIAFVSDPSTLMGQLLMANSMGILPNFARLWNLVPFSFVVDWFTNMSKRLHLVDDQVLWLALRVSFCTHSYKVVYYPSADRLAQFNLKQSEGGEPFGVSTYIREFTRITPRLVDSPIDFLRPTTGPDPVTVGSLLWQFI